MKTIEQLANNVNLGVFWELSDEDYLQRLTEFAEAYHVQKEAEKWISVEKEYPERIEGRRILCFSEGYFFESVCDEGYWCNVYGDDFTHWQPRPPLPISKDGE